MFLYEELGIEYFDSKPEAIEPRVDHEELVKGYYILGRLGAYESDSGCVFVDH